MSDEEDVAQSMKKTLWKGCSKEREKSNILEVVNENFANIITERTIEVNGMQKEGKRGKISEKEGNENRRLEEKTCEKARNEKMLKSKIWK